MAFCSLILFHILFLSLREREMFGFLFQTLPFSICLEALFYLFISYILNRLHILFGIISPFSNGWTFSCATLESSAFIFASHHTILLSICRFRPELILYKNHAFSFCCIRIPFTAQLFHGKITHISMKYFKNHVVLHQILLCQQCKNISTVHRVRSCGADWFIYYRILKIQFHLLLLGSGMICRIQ